MNNVSAFCLQRSRLHQDFKRSLSPETRHALGEAKFVGLSHDGEMSIKEEWRNLSFSAHDEGSLLTSHSLLSFALHASSLTVKPLGHLSPLRARQKALPNRNASKTRVREDYR